MLWKWLILALAIYVLYRLFANDLKKKFSNSKKNDEKATEAAAENMVKDPECGAYVAADSTITVRDGEQVHHFCSYDCRDKFLKRLESGGRVLPDTEKKAH